MMAHACKLPVCFHYPHEHAQLKKAENFYTNTIISIILIWYNETLKMFIPKYYHMTLQHVAQQGK